MTQPSLGLVKIQDSIDDFATHDHIFYDASLNPLGAGAVGTVYRAQDTTYQPKVIKIKENATVSDDEFWLEYDVVKSIYTTLRNSMPTSSLPVPLPLMAKGVVNNRAALVMPMFMPEQALMPKFIALRYEGDFRGIESLSLKSMQAFALVMHGLRQVGKYSCTDRKTSDFFETEEGAIFIIDWNIVGDYKPEFFATEVNLIGTLWYEFALGKNMPAKPDPFNDAEWQPISSAPIVGGALSLGLRALMSACRSLPTSQRFTDPLGNPSLYRVHEALRAWDKIITSEVRPTSAYFTDFFTTIRDAKLSDIELEAIRVDALWRLGETQQAERRQQLLEQIEAERIASRPQTHHIGDDEILQQLQAGSARAANQVTLEQIRLHEQQGDIKTTQHKKRWQVVASSMVSLSRLPSDLKDEFSDIFQNAAIILSSPPQEDTIQTLYTLDERLQDDRKALQSDRTQGARDGMRLLKREIELRRLAINYRQATSLQDKLGYVSQIEHVLKHYGTGNLQDKLYHLHQALDLVKSDEMALGDIAQDITKLSTMIEERIAQYTDDADARLASDDYLIHPQDTWGGDTLFNAILPDYYLLKLIETWWEEPLEQIQALWDFLRKSHPSDVHDTLRPEIEILQAYARCLTQHHVINLNGLDSLLTQASGLLDKNIIRWSPRENALLTLTNEYIQEADKTIQEATSRRTRGIVADGLRLYGTLKKHAHIVNQVLSHESNQATRSWYTIERDGETLQSLEAFFTRWLGTVHTYHLDRWLQDTPEDFALLQSAKDLLDEAVKKGINMADLIGQDAQDTEKWQQFLTDAIEQAKAYAQQAEERARQAEERAQKTQENAEAMVTTAQATIDAQQNALKDFKTKWEAYQTKTGETLEQKLENKAYSIGQDIESKAQKAAKEMTEQTKQKLEADFEAIKGEIAQYSSDHNAIRQEFNRMDQLINGVANWHQRQAQSFDRIVIYLAKLPVELSSVNERLLQLYQEVVRIQTSDFNAERYQKWYGALQTILKSYEELANKASSGMLANKEYRTQYERAVEYSKKMIQYAESKVAEQENKHG